MATAADIAARIRRTLQSIDAAALVPFLAQWPHDAAHRPIAAAALPVLRWLEDMAQGPAGFAADLIVALRAAAPALAWRQTYSPEQLGARFMDNYGWCEIIGTSGPLQSIQIACGFLLLGPQTLYPHHRHEAEELYLPLSGIAEWQQGSSCWVPKLPGTPIHHAGNESHAMRTGTAPLLALYLWRGNLQQKARLDA